VPRWEPETVKYEPETVNRKSLQVTKSLKSITSPLKTEGRRFERALLRSRNALETQNRCLEAWVWGYLISS
jgi:hypothetical protein